MSPLRWSSTIISAIRSLGYHASTKQVHFKSLRNAGFAVVDNCFGSKSDDFRDAILAMQDCELLLPNSTKVLKNGQSFLLQKRDILEQDFKFEDIRELSPALNFLHHDTTLAQNLMNFFPNLKISDQAIKVQYNTGQAGCFPLHFDADPSDGSHRAVSSVLYLNPQWDTKLSGGQLRLYPLPFAHVDISPRHDRLVLFSSPYLLHRVLPAYSPRVCLTVRTL